MGERDRAVNMVVLGPPPDRLRRDHRSHQCRVEVDGRLVVDGPCTTVVVANGEYLRGLDVVPRGHPGDGRFEVHVYAVPPAERRRMRSRLRTGTHVPHPGIMTAQGMHVVVQWDGPVRQEIDGAGRPPTRALEVTLGAGELTLVP
jgi:diacylglycerol kinase family enzyme